MNDKEKTRRAVWKSVLVKSIRMGWVAGCEHAAGELPASEVISVAHGQIFEDLFPSAGDLAAVIGWIAARDWRKICEYGTIHANFELTCKIMSAVDGMAAVDGYYSRMAGECGLRVPPRAMRCFAAWWDCREIPVVPPVCRVADLTPWHPGRIPAAMMDRHVGRWRGDTILTGTTDGHRRLSGMVSKEGWKNVRSEIHKNTVADCWSAPRLDL
jgi:hypothetical protein